MPTASEPAALDDALARAVLWRHVARGFSPPGIDPRRALEDETERRGLQAAVERLGLTAYEPGPTVGLETRFAELFGHTVRATVCPYETEYGAGRVFQQTQELADLRGWYVAFGLERREDAVERADHIGVECEFAGFLCRKEALALAGNDGEQLEIGRLAYRRFLRDHLARFGMAVTVRIEKVDGDGFYGRLAGLCRRLLLAECRRLDIEPGPRALPLRPDSEDDVPAACGAGDCDGKMECDGASPLGRAAPRRLLSIGDGNG
ncbi:MAG: TorD/DmsD family molecular chaperone [Planctomycetota bacterium]|jgi:TorA maturation chaperone TorD